MNKEIEGFDNAANKAMKSQSLHLAAMIAVPMVAAHVVQASIQASQNKSLSIDEKRKFITDSIKQFSENLKDKIKLPGINDVIDDLISNLEKPQPDTIEFEGFEKDLVDLFGDKIRNDDEFAKQIWSALTNITWTHENGTEFYNATFRTAGGLIADIRGTGNYMHWYCESPDGIVSNEIETAMKTKDWTWREYD